MSSQRALPILPLDGVIIDRAVRSTVRSSILFSYSHFFFKKRKLGYLPTVSVCTVAVNTTVCQQRRIHLNSLIGLKKRPHRRRQLYPHVHGRNLVVSFVTFPTSKDLRSHLRPNTHTPLLLNVLNAILFSTSLSR
jgi:hypothetical protein